MATASTAYGGGSWRAATACLLGCAGGAAAAAAAALSSLAEGFHVSSRLDFSYTRDESSRLNSRTAACRVNLESQEILRMYFIGIHIWECIKTKSDI